MVNIAFYHILGDQDCIDFRPTVLTDAGSRSIMVTDVDINRIAQSEVDEIGITVVPTVIIRDDGEIILWQEGLVEAGLWQSMVDTVIASVNENYVR